MKKTAKITRRESSAALQAQAPVEKPEAIKAMGIFSKLLGQPTVDAGQLLGSERTEWINAMEKENPLFPSGGNFSRPFFALRAWYFASKNATQKDRMGLKMAMADEKIYHISLSYPFKLDEDSGELLPIYPDREAVLTHFENSTTPIGLMQFEKVDRGENNPYWRLIHADEHSMELAGETVASPQIEAGDETTPF